MPLAKLDLHLSTCGKPSATAGWGALGGSVCSVHSRPLSTQIVESAAEAHRDGRAPSV